MPHPQLNSPGRKPSHILPRLLYTILTTSNTDQITMSWSEDEGQEPAVSSLFDLKYLRYAPNVDRI